MVTYLINSKSVDELNYHNTPKLCILCGQIISDTSSEYDSHYQSVFKGVRYMFTINMIKPYELRVVV